MIDVLLGDVGVEVLAFDEAQEELVYHLDVGPGDLEHGFVFFRVEGVPLRVHRRGDRAEQILGEHVDDTAVHGLHDDLPVVRDVVQKLMESETLDLLGFHIGARVVEVEDDVALIDLLHEEVLASVGRYLMEAGELLEFSLGRDVEARRMLSPWGPDALGHILWRGLETFEHQRFGSGFGRRKVAGHGLGCARGWNMLGT